MSILITKNIFFLHNIGEFQLYFMWRKKCSKIEHCLKCEKEDKWDSCQIGYIFNEDRKKCELKWKSNLKNRRRRISQKEGNTCQETSVSSIKSTTSSKNEEVKPSKSNDSS